MNIQKYILPASAAATVHVALLWFLPEESYTRIIGLPLVSELFPAWSGMSHMDRWAQLFVDAASDAPPLSGAEVGLRTMEVFAAARWSAVTGAVVKLPLPPEAEEASYPIP